MAAVQPPAGPPIKGKGKLAAWVKKNPAAAAAVGAGGLLGAFVLIRKGKANAGADAGGGATSTLGTVDPSLYGTPADLAGVGGIGSDPAAGLSEQINALQNQLTAMTQAAAPPQFKGSKYVTKTGQLQPWVMRRLGAGSAKKGRGVRPWPIDKRRRK